MSKTGQAPPASAKLDSFYGDLEKMLLKQIEQQPAQHEVRLKLLELYFETHRKDDFMVHASALRSRLRDGAAASREWQKCLSMGRILDPKAPLFQARGENIEFIDPALAGSKGSKIVERRFGQEPRHAPAFDALAKECAPLLQDPKFIADLDRELMSIARRPSALLHLRRLSAQLGGAQIFLKREDHSPDDTHLTMSIVGSALAAERLGRRTLVTGTVDGRCGVIVSAVAAHFGLESIVYVDAAHLQRQSGNVSRMWLTNAKLQTVDAKTHRNGDIREAALEHWVRDARRSMLVVGLDAAPAPFPDLARLSTAVIGRETKRQVMAATRRAPDLLVARGGATEDALGFFTPFVEDPATRLVCVSPVSPAAHLQQAAASNPFDPSRVPLTASEQKLARTILEGLEYPGVVREHAWLKDSGRVDYVSVPADTARSAIKQLAHSEGIIPALETASALGWAFAAARAMKPDQSVVVMVAEDSSKDIWDLGRLMGVPV